MATYYGTNGNDFRSGTRSNDLIYLYDGNDTCYGNNGDDIIYGGSGNDTLYGSSGDDILVGDSGNDILSGGLGNDTLYGGTGNDILDGHGSGIDYDSLYGGSGSDTFVLGSRNNFYYWGNGYATIRDWNYAEDWIQVRGSASQYRLVTGNWAGSSARDTAIVYGNDIIGLVQDSTNVSLSRDFKFV